jgi:glycosyltransferase 2 family protein
MSSARSTALSLLKKPPRNAIKAALTLLIAASVGVTLVEVLTRRPHVHLRFVPGWLCLSVAGFALATLVQPTLWRLLLASLGSRIEWRRGLAIWSISALARYVPTSMLMPVVRVSMSRRQNVPPGICAASMIYEAVLALCGSLWVASYLLIGLPALHNDLWRWGVLLLPLAFMFALHPRAVSLVSRPLLQRLGQEPLPVHLPLKRLCAFTAGYAANFLLAGASLIALILACHPLSPADAPVVIGAFALGFTAAAFGFILPAGLGAREAALVGGLALVIPALVATTVAVASRLIQLVLEILLASITPWLASRHEAREEAEAQQAAEQEAGDQKATEQGPGDQDARPEAAAQTS